MKESATSWLFELGNSACIEVLNHDLSFREVVGRLFADCGWWLALYVGIRFNLGRRHFGWLI